MLLITVTPLPFLLIFKNNACLKLNNFLFNTFRYGAFAWITNSQLILNSTPPEKAVCWDRYKYIIEKDSWSLVVQKIELPYDEKDIKIIYHGHTLPCLHDDGFCTPTNLTPSTNVWFPDDLCLIFSIHSFIGRMSKLNNSYWLETDHFVFIYKSQIPCENPYHDSESQTRLSFLKSSPKVKRFAINPHHFILRKILISLLHIKKDSICILANAILFNLAKMNNLINSPLNSFLVNLYMLIRNFFFRL